MGWMVAAASIIPNGLKHDSSVLKLWPDPSGPQHDEQANGWLKKGLRHLPEDEATHESKATMHKSVYRRFEGRPVLIFHRIGPYRPVNIAQHVDFKQYFGDGATAQSAQNPQCVADDIEAKWEAACFRGRIWGVYLELSCANPATRQSSIPTKGNSVVISIARKAAQCRNGL
jgi:hypothetical protein